ncbi:MAG: VWA domain-containing protein, partial [Terriglobales bacterium]
QQPDSQQPPEAGGPQGDVGPYTVPKKKDAPPPEPVRAPKNPPELGNFSITKDVALVTVPVTIALPNGQPLPGLKEANFKVFEDGVEQKITSFNLGKAPITAVLVVEFAATYYAYMIDAMRASYAFAQSLRPDDWIAVIDYNMHTEIAVDFTQDKREVVNALNRLRLPGWRETNEFDALNETIDRLERVEGRKYLILVSSGHDSFSRLTYDKILKRVHNTKDITIYTISTGQAFRTKVEGSGGVEGSMRDMTWLQDENEMRTFAKMTGGQAYFPRFAAEFPEIFQDIGNSIRNQYLLAYHPTNPQLDGSYRKLKVEVIDPQTGAPLEVKDQKNKKLKYTIIAREGYTAKHEVD